VTELLAAFPDVEADVLPMALAGIQDATVGTETPADFVRYIRALRTGGTDDGITDSPICAVTTYAPTRAESVAMSAEAGRRIRALAATDVGGVLIDYTSVYTGPLEQPDLNPDIRAVTTYYVIEYRRPREA
jgi:hypothetical protein